MTPRIRFGFFIIALTLAASPMWPRPQQQLTPITINYPTRTGQVWPLYIAKEGGYYAKYGYDVKLAFGVHPAGIAMLVSGEAVMTPYTLRTGDAGQFEGCVTRCRRQPVQEEPVCFDGQ